MTRRYHHGNLRAALIDGALAAIAEKGPEGFTLRDVARRAGVTPGAPYRHFADKDELLAAVGAECMERLGAAIAAAVAAADDDPLDRFRATGIAYVRFAAENPAHFRALSLPGMEARLPPAQRAAADAWRRAEREALAEAQRRGHLAGLPLDDVLLAAHCIVHGLAHVIIEGREGLAGARPARAADVAVRVTRVLGAGLMPRKEGVPKDPRRR